MALLDINTEDLHRLRGLRGCLPLWRSGAGGQHRRGRTTSAPPAAPASRCARSRRSACRSGQQAAAEGLSAYQGVWVWVEQFQGEASSISWEMLGQGRKLADQRKCAADRLRAGPRGRAHRQARPSPTARTASSWWMTPPCAVYRTEPYARRWWTWCASTSRRSFCWAPARAGATWPAPSPLELYTGLTADCTGLDIDPETRLLRQTRPAFGGNIMATIICPNYRPQMSTVRHRVFEMPSRRPHPAGADRARRAGAMSEEQIATKVVDFLMADRDR